MYDGEGIVALRHSECINRWLSTRECSENSQSLDAWSPDARPCDPGCSADARTWRMSPGVDRLRCFRELKQSRRMSTAAFVACQTRAKECGRRPFIGCDSLARSILGWAKFVAGRCSVQKFGIRQLEPCASLHHCIMRPATVVHHP